MISGAVRALSVGTTPVNLRKAASWGQDPNALPVTYSTIFYASGGANIALLPQPFATGALTFVSVPVASETIAVNGVTYTFTATPASATDVLIGATKEDCCAALAEALRISASASLIVAKYVANQHGNPAVLNITSTTAGTGGNSFTLANSSGTAITRSASTLTGGPAYAQGTPIVAGADYNCVDQSLAIYIVADATGPTTVEVTDNWA